MSTFTSLRPPPLHMGSMASLTSFTIDSARALSAVNDLAALRSALAEERSSRSAPVPWASSSRCSLEVMSPAPERAPKLVPASFPQASSYSEASSPSASPASSPTVWHRPSPISQRSLSDAPAFPGPHAVPIAFQPHGFSLPHEPTGQPLLGPVASAFPLAYMVTTSEHVQASNASAGAQLPSSLFFHGAVPYYQAPTGAFIYGWPMRPDLQPAPRVEEPPAKKRRRRSRSKVSESVKVSQLKPTTSEAASLAKGDDVPRDVQPLEEAVATPAVEPNSGGIVKMECRWPGCVFTDEPGKLWNHIKDTHGTEDTARSNVPGPQQNVAAPLPALLEEETASVPPPQDPPSVAPTPGPPEQANSTAAAVSKMRRSRKRCVHNRIHCYRGRSQAPSRPEAPPGSLSSSAQ